MRLQGARMPDGAQGAWDHRERLADRGELFTAALDKHKVPPRERSEFVQIIENMKSSIVEVQGRR